MIQDHLKFLRIRNNKQDQQKTVKFKPVIYSDKSSQFENMPVGYKARFIAHTAKDEQVFAYLTELTIAKGLKMPFNLKEINDKDFTNFSDQLV